MAGELQLIRTIRAERMTEEEAGRFLEKAEMGRKVRRVASLEKQR